MNFSAKSLSSMVFMLSRKEHLCAAEPPVVFLLSYHKKSNRQESAKKQSIL